MTVAGKVFAILSTLDVFEVEAETVPPMCWANMFGLSGDGRFDPTEERIENGWFYFGHVAKEHDLLRTLGGGL